MLKKIKKEFSKIFISSIISSAIFIVMGLLLFLKPENTISTISYILGIMIILLGAMSFAKYFQDKETTGYLSFNLVCGILSMVIGLLIIFNPFAIATFIPIFLGLWMIINSTLKIQYSLDLKKYNSDSWITTLIMAIVNLILGLILVFNPFDGVVFITKIIGLFIIIYSVIDITESIIINKNIKTVVKIVK